MNAPRPFGPALRRVLVTLILAVALIFGALHTSGGWHYAFLGASLVAALLLLYYAVVLCLLAVGHAAVLVAPVLASGGLSLVTGAAPRGAHRPEPKATSLAAVLSSGGLSLIRPESDGTPVGADRGAWR